MIILGKIKVLLSEIKKSEKRLLCLNCAFNKF